MLDALTTTGTANLPTQTEPTTIVAKSTPDPHASKMPADHPGLRLRRPPFRVLRRGPIVGISMALAAVAAIALGRGFLSVDNAPAAELGNQTGPQAPAAANLEVADLVKNAPGNNSPVNGGRSKPPIPPTVVAAPPAASDPRTAVLTQSMAGGQPPDGGVGKQPPHTPSPEAEACRQERERARAAGLFFAGEGETPSGDRPTAPSRPLVAGAVDNAGVAARPGGDPDPNGQSGKTAFMRENAKDHSTYNASQVLGPLSPYEVKAGSIIPTTLITGINSDLPGEVVAQVRENVYDSISGAYLLIPQGSRLLARYDSAIAYGQERVVLCWQRLIRPDGTSLSLECAPGVDLAGQAGFADEVDHHWGKLITGVVLSSLLAAVTQAATGNVDGYRPSLAQSFTAGAAGDMASAGQQITRKNIGIQPTVKIRPGYSVNVLVNKDLVIPPYQSL
jgi:type IV secretory pathway VirB10-like protein